MSYYPVFLELRDRRCIVIGGGAVAERKVEGLLAAKAAVTVVSPAFTERLTSLGARGVIELVARQYQSGDLDGHELAFVATGDTKLAALIQREAREKKVWVNAADDPEHCDFILPSVFRRGPLTVAVATGGASPALSRLIREKLESHITAEYATLAEIAAEARAELKNRSQRADPERWHDALDSSLRQLIRDGKRAAAKAYLLKKLGSII
ncbi:MAG TPA: bifunctional precorrin-2 dehydrogenase/sirohydrochlorin ferrochelatase [Candidatus Acidoferrales bacterium]|nr:bifunctional precorrin-2 dehydrogenase/sirohydrochlorin ferrochelatase [Candidatus Acidoferrales bacterium]